MWLVAKIYESDLKIGRIEMVDDYEAAIDTAQEFVSEEYEARKMYLPGCSSAMHTVREALRERNCFLFACDGGGDCTDGCEQGKAVMIQIIDTEK